MKKYYVILNDEIITFCVLVIHKLPTNFQCFSQKNKSKILYKKL